MVHQSNSKSELSGWNLVVLSAAFIIQLFTEGIEISFGIFISKLIEVFDASRESLGWIPSIKFALLFLIAPIGSNICSRFGIRVVACTGSIIAASGYGISFFASKVWHLYITMGVLGGIGTGFIILSSTLTLSSYFSRYRSTAIGIAGVGTGIGAVIFSPVSKLYMEAYSWQGLLLLQSGFYLNCFALSLLFLPVEESERLPISKSPKGSPERVPDGDERRVHYASMPSTESTGDGLNDELILKHRSIEVKLGTRSQAAAMRSVDMTSRGWRSLRSGHHQDVDEELNQGQSVEIPHSVVIRGNKQQNNAVQFDAYTTKITFRNKNKSVPRLIYKTATNQSNSSASRRFTRCCLALGWDTELFKNVGYCLYLASSVLKYIGIVPPFVFTTDRAVKAGHSKNRASLLMSNLGLTGMLGRITFAMVSDRHWIDNTVMSGVLTTLSGIILILSFLTVHNYAIYMAACAVYGILIGGTFPLKSAILIDLLGIQKFFGSFGIASFYQGLGTCLASPIFGLIYDNTQNYDYGFVFSGVALTISGLLIISMKFCRSTQKPILVEIN